MTYDMIYELMYDIMLTQIYSMIHIVCTCDLHIFLIAYNENHVDVELISTIKS